MSDSLSISPSNSKPVRHEGVDGDIENFIFSAKFMI